MYFSGVSITIAYLYALVKRFFLKILIFFVCNTQTTAPLSMYRIREVRNRGRVAPILALQRYWHVDVHRGVAGVSRNRVHSEQAHEQSL